MEEIYHWKFKNSFSFPYEHYYAVNSMNSEELLILYSKKTSERALLTTMLYLSSYLFKNFDNYHCTPTIKKQLSQLPDQGKKQS